jgi:FemAB-related protein (PEP-CTERM system-associated)
MMLPNDTAPQRITIREVAADDGRWNTFVAQHPLGTAFHRWEWKEVHERTFGHRCRFLMAEGGHSVLGVLPLVETRSPVFGRYLVSMPYVSYGGPLALEPESERLLCDAAVRRREGNGLLQLRSAGPLNTDLSLSQHKATVLLDLEPGDPAAVFKRFSAKLRSQVRRSAKAGIEVRFGAQYTAAFVDVLQEHMRDLGSPAHGRRFYESIVTAFGEDVWVGCAYMGREPVAAGLAFRYGDEVEITWASALRRYSQLSPNMALYWAFIERAAAEGAARFNFGRCTPGAGTHKFKLQWGGRTVPLFWYSSREGDGGRTPTPDQAVYGLAARVWQRLPVALTRVIGPAVVRGIP